MLAFVLEITLTRDHLTGFLVGWATLFLIVLALSAWSQ